VLRRPYTHAPTHVSGRDRGSTDSGQAEAEAAAAAAHAPTKLPTSDAVCQMVAVSDDGVRHFEAPLVHMWLASSSLHCRQRPIGDGGPDNNRRRAFHLRCAQSAQRDGFSRPRGRRTTRRRGHACTSCVVAALCPGLAALAAYPSAGAAGPQEFG
jgi:hypothetical protein